MKIAKYIWRTQSETNKIIAYLTLNSNFEMDAIPEGSALYKSLVSTWGFKISSLGEA